MVDTTYSVCGDFGALYSAACTAPSVRHESPVSRVPTTAPEDRPASETMRTAAVYRWTEVGSAKSRDSSSAA